VTDETTTERIRKRAYQLYVERGREPGRELEDWIEAEETELLFGTDPSEWQVAYEEKPQPLRRSAKA
jgi:Protein of unknown function (DUF2934)